MQIAFWSPNHGQTGTTTTALTWASAIAINHPYKVLIGHSHFRRSTLERCLLPVNHHDFSEVTFVDKGINALKRLGKNGRLMPSMVSDYTTSLLARNRFDLLEGEGHLDAHTSEEEMQLLMYMFDCANEAYDLVMVDVHSGLNQELTRQILDHFDVVVVCLNQNQWLIEDYLSDQTTLSVLQDKKVIYHIGLYDPRSKYTLKNLSKKYHLTPLISTQYNPDYRDACNQGLALDYLLRHQEVRKKTSNYDFMHNLQEGVKELLDYLNMDEQKVLTSC